ncbi:hypothetical protein [Streptomyces sp. 3213.3]|nr:hypothetical protein [Streptomyces sp. 3213.3]
MNAAEPDKAALEPFAQVSSTTSRKCPQLPELRDDVNVDDYRIVRCVK